MKILEFQMMIGKKIIEMSQDIKNNKWLSGIEQSIKVDGQEYKVTLKKVKK